MQWLTPFSRISSLQAYVVEVRFYQSHSPGTSMAHIMLIPSFPVSPHGTLPATLSTSSTFLATGPDMTWQQCVNIFAPSSCSHVQGLKNSFEKIANLPIFPSSHLPHHLPIPPLWPMRCWCSDCSRDPPKHQGVPPIQRYYWPVKERGPRGTEEKRCTQVEVVCWGCCCCCCYPMMLYTIYREYIIYIATNIHKWPHDMQKAFIVLRPNLGVGHAVGQKLQDKGLVLCARKGLGTLCWTQPSQKWKETQ